MGGGAYEDPDLRPQTALLPWRDTRQPLPPPNLSRPLSHSVERHPPLSPRNHSIRDGWHRRRPRRKGDSRPSGLPLRITTSPAELRTERCFGDRGGSQPPIPHDLAHRVPPCSRSDGIRRRCTSPSALVTFTVVIMTCIVQPRLLPTHNGRLPQPLPAHYYISPHDEI